MARRPAPALLGTLLVAAALAAGCPGAGNEPAPPTVRIGGGTKASPKASPPPTATPSPLPTIGTPSSPSPLSPQPSVAPSVSPSASVGPSTSPTPKPSKTPRPSSLLSYAADLPLTNNVGAGGAAIGLLSSDAKTFKVAVWVVGATGDLTFAHLHKGAEGQTGDLVKTLTLDATTHRSATGTWTAATPEPMTSTLLSSLKSGGVYADVHTATNPNGESRGNLEPYLWAGAADLRPVAGATNANSAVGVAWLALGAGKDATLKVYTAGLSGDLTAAHVHQGTAAETGTLVKTLDIAPDKKTASGTWAFGTSGGALTDALITDLKAGKLYVDLHTGQNPNGEVRGQILAP